MRFEEKGEIETSFYFYWKGRELYFVIVERGEKVKILKSWTGNWITVGDFGFWIGVATIRVCARLQGS